MKNGGRITAVNDKNHMDAASNAPMKKKKEGGFVVRKDDPAGKYAKLRPSRVATPEGSRVIDRPEKEDNETTSGGPGVTLKYSGRTLPPTQEVTQAVENTEPLKKARQDAEEAKR